jgi:hypothetical protein
MSRKHVEELGYTFVEKDLPPIIKEWCISDSILCLIENEFPYKSTEAVKMLKPIPTADVLKSYSIYAVMIVYGGALQNSL